MLLLNGINYPIIDSFEEWRATSLGGFKYDTSYPSEKGDNFAS